MIETSDALLDSQACVASFRLDQQHEKGVNLLEFVAATLSPEDVANDELLRKTFQIFDRNHSGGITHQDLLGMSQHCLDVVAH